MGYLVDTLILVVPFNEQKSIIEYLDEVFSKFESLISKRLKRIELLKEYRQSLISDVVTGKVDVRDEVLEWVLPNIYTNFIHLDH